LRRCRFHLPLRRNRRSVAIGSNPIFAVLQYVNNQPISILVTSSRCIRKDVSSISVLTRNGNGSYTERKNSNGTTERQNGTAKRQRQNCNGMVETMHQSLSDTCKVLLQRVSIACYAERCISHDRFCLTV